MASSNPTATELDWCVLWKDTITLSTFTLRYLVYVLNYDIQLCQNRNKKATEEVFKLGWLGNVRNIDFAPYQKRAKLIFAYVKTRAKLNFARFQN